MLPVFRKQLEREILRNAVQRPRDRVWFVAAHAQTAHVLLPIGEPIRIAQGRQVRGHPLDGFGDQILVLHGLQGHRHVCHAPDLLGPLTSAVDDDLATDFPVWGLHGGDASVFHPDARDRGFLDDPHPAHPCPFGEGLGDVGGIGLSVSGQKGGSDQIVSRHQRPELLGIVRGEQFHLQPKAVGSGRLPLEFDPAFLGAGEPQSAVHLPARGLSGFRLNGAVEVHAVLEQPCGVGRTAQLPHESGGVEGAAAGELSALK